MYQAFFFSIVTALLSVMVGAPGVRSTEVPERALSAGSEAMPAPLVISPSVQEITIGGEQAIYPRHPDQLSGTVSHDSFQVEVMTILPEWAVSLAAEPLRGATGSLPPERLWVRTPMTADSFAALREPIMVLRGDRRQTVRQSPIEVSFRPLWADAAGDYSGRLTLSSHQPGLSGHDEPLDGRIPTGREHRISVSVTIPEIIEISLSEASISFDNISGPGVYESSNRLTFRISSNSTHWRIVCHAEPFHCERDPEAVIPPERIGWELTGADRAEVSGTLEPHTVLLAGEAPVENLEVEVIFKVEVLTRDMAGDYTANIHLRGEVDY